MRRLLLLIAALAAWDCHRPEPESAVHENRTAAPEKVTIALLAEPMYDTVAHRPYFSPQPLVEYRKYGGSIEGESSFTVDLNLKDLGGGLGGHGKYRSDREGVSRSLFAAFHHPDSFKIKVWDTSGNHILEILRGRFISLDSFQGTWTRYQPDSIEDPKYGTWRKTIIPRKRSTFTLTQIRSSLTPVRFRIFRRESDSASRARIREGRVGNRFDSLPSNLDFILPSVHTGRDSIDSLINLGMERSMKEFCLSGWENPFPSKTALPYFVDSLFALKRKWMEERYFTDDYDSEVLANANGVLSVRYSWSGDGGGAHGSDDHVFETWDVATGRKLGLRDILAPDYKDRLGLAAGVPSCDGDPEREYPCTIEGLVKKGFALEPDGIRFHATLGLDERDVLVPYPDIVDLIEPGGILERFRK